MRKGIFVSYSSNVYQHC